MGVYVSALVVFIVSVIGAGAIGFTKGRDSRSDEVASYQAAIAVSEKLAADAEDRAAKVRATVVTEYRDRVKVIREKVPGETQYIEVIKRESTCDAPGAFRVLHDSAASGSNETQGAAGTDAAPVPLEVVAETIAENYRISRETAARLEALQTLIRSQSGNDH